MSTKSTTNYKIYQLTMDQFLDIKNNNELSSDSAYVLYPDSVADYVSDAIDDAIENSVPTAAASAAKNVLYTGSGKYEQTYTDLYGAANDWASATFYFINLIPTDWNAEWTIKYRIEVEVTGSASGWANYKGTYQCMISGSRGVYSTYHFFNSMYSTSYRPIYYHVVHNTTQTGYNNGVAHKIGISLYNANNGASSSYPRKIKVVILECQNCTATLNETPEVPSSSTKTGYTKLDSSYHTTTNSNAAGNYNLLDGYSNGLRESGDDNTVITYGTLAYYLRPYMAAYLSPYQFVMFDKDNRLVPLSSTQFPAYASGTTYGNGVYVYYSNVIYKSLQASNKGHTPGASSSSTWWQAQTTPHTPTSLSFKPDKIYWYNTTTAVSAGAVVTANTLMSNGYNQPNMAICNFNVAVPAYRMMYLCGTYDKATGLFTLRGAGTAGSTQYYTLVPSNTANITLSSYFTSGYDYILVGGTYSSNNYLHLREDHPMYHFDGTNLIPYDTWYADNNIVNADFLYDYDEDDWMTTITSSNYNLIANADAITVDTGEDIPYIFRKLCDFVDGDQNDAVTFVCTSPTNVVSVDISSGGAVDVTYKSIPIMPKLYRHSVKISNSTVGTVYAIYYNDESTAVTSSNFYDKMTSLAGGGFIPLTGRYGTSSGGPSAYMVCPTEWTTPYTFTVYYFNGNSPSYISSQTFTLSGTYEISDTVIQM